MEDKPDQSTAAASSAQPNMLSENPTAAPPEGPDQAEAMPQAGVARPPARPNGSFMHMMDSPVLLPMLQQIEPSPSTSLMSFAYPMLQTGLRPPLPPTTQTDGMNHVVAAPMVFPNIPNFAFRNLVAQPRVRYRRESAANDDGYNWRKYGEKQVKGSPYPRSYYKCSYPGCTVKKIIERDPRTGIISAANARVSGEHNHAKPTSNKATPNSGDKLQALSAVQEQSYHDSGHDDTTNTAGGAEAASHAHNNTTATAAGQQQQQQAGDPDGAAAALQLLGTGFSPPVPMLGITGQQETPASLLPIPPSLRTSAEPEDMRRWGRGLGRPGFESEYEDDDEEDEGDAMGSEIARDDSEAAGAAHDNNEDDGGEWEPHIEFACESEATAAAAGAAADAVSLAMKRERQLDEIAGMLGKRRRRRPSQFGGPGGGAKGLTGAAGSLLPHQPSPTFNPIGPIPLFQPTLVGKRRRTTTLEPEVDDSYLPKTQPFASLRGMPAEEEPINVNVPQHQHNLGAHGQQQQQQQQQHMGMLALNIPNGNVPINNIRPGMFVPEERTIVETETEADNIEDGYRWRKYGQKIVKGNPHPRSYYKCTNQECGVRKQVERSSRDQRVLITTYEGSHNHEPPAQGSLIRNSTRKKKTGETAANKSTTTTTTTNNKNNTMQAMQAFQMTNMPGTVNSNLPMFMGGPALHIMAARGGSMASLAAANVFAAARHMGGGGVMPTNGVNGINGNGSRQPSPNPQQQMLQMQQQFAQAYQQQQQQHQMQQVQEAQQEGIENGGNGNGGSGVKIEQQQGGAQIVDSEEDELKGGVGDGLSEDVREQVNGLTAGQVPLPTAMV